MTNPESSKPTSFLDIAVPEDIVSELEKENFEEIVERLWDLGVVPATLPESPIVYSRPFGSDGHLAMVAYGEEIFDAENDRGTIGQRLIFNTRSEDEATGLPKITVEDYIVDYSDDTLTYRKSVISSQKGAGGTAFVFGKNMAPFINLDGVDLNLTFGRQYEEDYSKTFAQNQDEAIAGESLVEKLRLLNPALRDPISNYHAYIRSL